MHAFFHLPSAHEASRRIDLINADSCAHRAHKELQDTPSLSKLIKSCGQQKDLLKGSRIHAELLKSGLLHKDIYVSTALIRMYAKCGLITKAQEVFDELPERDVASWNSLISAYAEHGLASKALDCSDQMLHEGLSPDAITFLCILKACGSIRAVDKGREIHAEVCRQGLLPKKIILGTALLDMYAKCGELANAQEVFDELPTRDVASWTALMAGYVQYGLGEVALNCFEQMRDEGIHPDIVTFVWVLKACGSIGASERGEEIHSEVCRQELLKKNNVLATALVDMYAKCGALAKAQGVFDELPAQDVASWTALITGYVQHGLGHEALNCFNKMSDKGLSPNVVTFVTILKACSSTGAIEKGKEIHAEVDRQGLLEESKMLCAALVDMYAKCGALAKAQDVFDKLPARDLASWNALMTGYAQHELGDEVLNCFQQMRDEGLSPDAVTYICILKACGSIGALELGEEIHAEVGRQGLLEKSNALGNTLVDMYAKCGKLTKAQEVFEMLPARDKASWNALISGYARQELGDKVLKCFGQMRDEGLSPDIVTFVCVLKACGSLGAVAEGEKIHAEVSGQGLLEKHTELGTALVDMYAKCGMFAKAQEVFDELPEQDVVPWTALITGYIQHGLNDEALNCFECMQNKGLSPNAVTFACILKACGNIGAMEKGEEIHAQISIQGLLQNNVILSRALLDMYLNCGALRKAQEVFDGLLVQDVVSWTALIAGYAQLGNVKRVFDLFTKMIGERIEPNVVTFVVLLTVCSHAGLVEEGQKYYDTMSTNYCIIPSLEHHCCMVDLFSRAGLFDKAISMIEKVRSSDCVPLWSALLSACRNSLSLEFGRLAFEQAVNLSKNYDSAYVCMSNIYAVAGMQEDVD